LPLTLASSLQKQDPGEETAYWPFTGFASTIRKSSVSMLKMKGKGVLDETCAGHFMRKIFVFSKKLSLLILESAPKTVPKYKVCKAGFNRRKQAER
jgi:hypothetical protein